MTAVNFAYWLQGYFELLHAGKFPPDAAVSLKGLSAEQTETVRRHLAMVFVHDIDPKAGDAASQEKLNGLHGIGQQMPDGSVARC